MPIYENTNTSTRDVYTGNNFGYLYNGTRIQRLDIAYREGTRRRKPEILDDTAYERREEHWRNPWGLFRKTLPGYAGYYGEDGQGDLSLNVLTEARQGPEFFKTNLKNLATQKALSKLDRMDMDFGTAFAESGKTGRMVGDLATMSVKALVALHKKDLSAFLRALNLSKPRMRGKGIVDAYLTYTYGINPLMQDIAGSTSALTRLPPEAWEVMVRGTGRDFSDRSIPVGLGTDWKYNARSSYEEGCRVKIRAKQRPLSRTEDVLWSLGLDNYGLTQAWELTPFSFVLDWALPIGEYIRGLTTLKYYEGWQVCTSQFKKESIIFSGWSGTTPDGWKYQSTAKGSWDGVHVKRTITEGPPMYGLPYKDPRSMDHMGKALALFVSVLASKGNPPSTLRI